MPITATALLRLWDMASSFVFGAPLPDSSLAGQEDGRTIPLADMIGPPYPKFNQIVTVSFQH